MASQLTRDKWAGMIGKAQWDCQVALRGPDIAHSSLLKHFTTNVIRAELTPVMRVGGSINRAMRLVILPADPLSLLGNRCTPFTPDLSHFISHVREAAMWLNIPIVAIPSDKWVEGMTRGSILDALRLFYPCVGTGPEKDLLRPFLPLNERT